MFAALPKWPCHSAWDIDTSANSLQSVEKRLGKEAREHIHDNDYMPLGTDLVASVKRDVQIVKDYPAIPNDTPVHGFIYDVANGSLEPVVTD